MLAILLELTLDLRYLIKTYVAPHYMSNYILDSIRCQCFFKFEVKNKVLSISMTYWDGLVIAKILDI